MKEKWIEKTINILLFLIGLDLFEKGSYIGILLFLFFVIHKVCNKEKIILNIEFLILTMFSISYSFIYTYYFGANLFIISYVLILLPIFYFVGINSDRDTSMKYILSFSSGLAIFGILNLFISINDVRELVHYNYIVNIWNSNLFGTTIQGALFTPIISLIFYSLFVCKNLYLKIILNLLVLFSIVNTFYTGRRTLFVIMVFVFILNIFLYIMENKRNKKVLINTLKIFILFTIGSLMLFFFNIFNIKNMLLNSQVITRLLYFFNNIESDARLTMYRFIFENWSAYMNGGVSLPEAPLVFAHNFWLDVFIKVGIIPFILLLIYTISTVISIVKLNMKNNINLEKKIVLTSIFLGLNFNFFLEPAIEAIPLLICLLVLTNGIIYRQLNSNIVYENKVVKVL